LFRELRLQREKKEKGEERERINEWWRTDRLDLHIQKVVACARIGSSKRRSRASLGALASVACALSIAPILVTFEALTTAAEEPNSFENGVAADTAPTNEISTATAAPKSEPAAPIP
jgi:hypothetical protein